MWFADERCVGPEDEQSNYRLAQRNIAHDRAACRPSACIAWRASSAPSTAPSATRCLLRERVPAQTDDRARAQGEEDDAPPALDVIVLGIGPDGHVASLFPGAPALDAGPQELCLPVRDSPKPPPERITLSLAVLRAARACVLLATSASKSDAVAAMLAEPSHHVPASLLRRGRLNVIVDDAAAPPPPLRM